jgi:hypothetical protein
MPTRCRPSPAQQRAAGKARRLGAAEVFAQGRMHAEVAPSSVSPARARTSGVPAGSRWDRGAAQPRADRPGPQAVSAAQPASVQQALLLSAKATRFDTDLWTLERSGW